MNESKMLTVVSVADPKKDKNGMEYKVIQLATPEVKRVKDVMTGEVKIVRAKIKLGTFNAFRKSYLSLYNMAQKKGCEIKDLKKTEIEEGQADFGYDVAVGENLEGEIITRRVTPYDIPDESTGEVRTVDFYTCPVLGPTEDEGFDQEIRVTFKRNGRVLLSNSLNKAEIKTEVKENAKLAFAK